MRKNADNLKISHRQLLSLALQGVPFALMNVFHKKKTYHKHFHKLHWHEFIPIIKTKSLEFVTETKPLAINSDYWKFLASKILNFSPEKHSTQWLRPVLPMFSLRWFMLIIRKINQKLTWTWIARKIFIPQDFISIKKTAYSSERLFPLHLYGKQPKFSCCIRWIVLFSATYLTKTLNI